MHISTALIIIFTLKNKFILLSTGAAEFCGARGRKAMKIVCEGIELSDALGKVVKACSTRTTNPILETVKLSAENDGLSLLATDGEISILKKIKAEVFEEGAVCVPGKYFAEFIKRLEREQISLSTEGETLLIEYADSQSTLQVLPAADFPAIDTDVDENKVALTAKDLKELIAKTTFCCAQDDSRPILKGCLIEAKEGIIRFTALDGYRLAVCRKNLVSMRGDLKIVCPGRTLNEIARMLGGDEEIIELCVGRNIVLVNIDDTVLTSRLYEGEFVNVTNIIPRDFASEILVDRAVLDESVDRASVLARTDKGSLILFDIREDSMDITSNTSIGRVEENVKILLEGKDSNIALNCKYVSECLNAIADEKIRIGMNGAVSPCVITPAEGDGFLYLILPVRPTTA